MEKIEKNDTDVFGTKEQTGKEKKRNRSKYYAKKKKNFRRKAPKFPEEVKEKTFRQNVLKFDEESGEKTFGQNVQKSASEKQRNTFGQNVLKSTETREEERKTRNKRRVRKESEKRKKEKEDNISQAEMIPVQEIKIMESTDFKTFEKEKDEKPVLESTLREKEISESLESTLEAEGNVKYKSVNEVKSSVNNKQEVPTHMDMRSGMREPEDTASNFELGATIFKSEKQRNTFGQNVLKSMETREEERKTRNKRRVRKEREKRKQKEETAGSAELIQKQKLKDGCVMDAEVSEKPKQEIFNKDISNNFSEKMEDTDGGFTFGQNVLKSAENRKEERKSRNKKRIRREAEKRQQKRESGFRADRNVIFQEKRAMEFTNLEKDEKKEVSKSFETSKEGNTVISQCMENPLEQICDEKGEGRRAAKVPVKRNKRSSSEITGKRIREEMVSVDDNFNLGPNALMSDAKTKEDTFGQNVQKSEKTGEKERKSRRKEQKGKFSTDTEYTLEQIFDEESGRTRYVAVPVKRKKMFSGDAVMKTAMGTVKRADMDYIREQTEQEEDENAATECMYQAQKNVERAFALTKGNQVFHRTGDKRNYSFKDRKQEDIKRKQEPESYKEKEQKKAFQKRMQKQKQKREYVKAIRKAVAERNLSEVILQTRNYTTMAASRMQKETVKHAGVLVTLGTALLLVVMMMTSISSCGAVFADMQSVILSAAYQSKPKEMDATDLQFTRKELELRNEIDNIERNYRGYDEYVYHLGSIGHNPFTLVNYLSAVYEEFQAEDVKREVDSLFGEMYRLTLQPVTEIRTRNVPVRDEYGDLVYDEYGNLETIEQDYEVHILKVTLNVTALENIVSGKMNQEQKEFYELYHETGGLLQVFDSPLEEKWHSHISSFYGYRKNPISGAEQIHRGWILRYPPEPECMPPMMER